MPNSRYEIGPNGQILDYYHALGVPRTADTQAIQSAYRRLALRCHPDKNPNNPAATARFRQLTDYKDVLEDADSRRRYDEALRTGISYSAGPRFAHRHRSQPSNNSNFAHPSNESYPQNRRRPARESVYDGRYPEPVDEFRNTHPRAWANRVYIRRVSIDDPRSGPDQAVNHTDDRRPKLRRATQRERSHSSTTHTLRGYEEPLSSHMRNENDRAQQLYRSMVIRCSRVCEQVKKANELLESFEKLGEDLLQETDREGATSTERHNTGMFCIVIDLLFEILEGTAREYERIVWNLNGAASEAAGPDTEFQISTLLRIDATVRGLAGCWNANERMLNQIDTDLQQGVPLTALTALVNNIITMWEKDFPLAQQMYLVIDVVQRVRKFEYEIGRSDRVIRIDRS